ncbi:oxidoreductase GLYR1-like protein [Trichonephila clavipes]|nr:oxidoreductase GLYR1-like protein [Trichonephila clavipes]
MEMHAIIRVNGLMGLVNPSSMNVCRLCIANRPCLIKWKNFPCWPAKIADPPTVLEEDFRTANGLQNMEKSERRKAQHYVLFFGSQDYAWVWDENIVPHSVEILHTNTPKSTLYEKAIDEIIAAGGVSVPNLKLVKKGPVDNGQSRIETKQKIKVEKTDDEIRLEFVRRSPSLLKKIKIEKKEEPSENELIKDPTIKDYKLSEESKSIKTKKLVEEDESSKNFSAVKTLGKTTNIPSVADDKDSTVLSIKKRTSKEKIKKPPQKRNLTEEACNRKLSPVRKLSGTSDDTPRNNTYNPVGVYRPFNDRSMTGPSIDNGQSRIETKQKIKVEKTDDEIRVERERERVCQTEPKTPQKD